MSDRFSRVTNVEHGGEPRWIKEFYTHIFPTTGFLNNGMAKIAVFTLSYPFVRVMGAQ